MRRQELSGAEEAVREGLERRDLQVRQRQAQPVRPITKKTRPAAPATDPVAARPPSASAGRPRAKKTYEYVALLF
jgi:hypothetical protein